MINDLVSIIVPIYNSEKYLKACLQSVLVQTYKNIEVLLIDDGSTDQSGAICDAYAKKDARIHVFHNQNHGVSYSRNCGIKFSKGEYLLFVDSDDTINTKYIEGLMQYTFQYDLIISSILDIWENKKSTRRIYQERGNLKNDYKNIIEFLRVPHSKLYRSNIIKTNNIFFPENIDWAEDQIFNWQYYQYVSSYAFSKVSQYQYFHRNNQSLSQHDEKADNIDLMKFVLDEYSRFLINKDVRNKDQLMCDRCIETFLYAGSGYTLFKVRCELIRRYLAGKYSASNWKRWLVLKCIEYEWYKVIYAYYRLKWTKQRWRE